MRTLHRDVDRVPPGHLMRVGGGRRELVRHWAPETLPELPRCDHRERVDEARRLFGEAVRARLRRPAGTAVASHLSGGFDSAAVTAVAADALAGDGATLHAYTAAPRAGFPVDRFGHRPTDESARAATVAARFPNVRHHVLRTAPDADPLAAVERMLPHLDAPTVNPCNAVWIDAVGAAAARQGARVLLTGVLGNMTLSYDGTPYTVRLAAEGRWLELARLVLGQRRDGITPRTALHTALSPLLPGALMRLRDRDPDRADLFEITGLSPTFAAAVDVEGLARRRRWDLTYRGWRDGRAMRIAVMRRVEIGVQHHAVLARNGVDVRDPTADRRLVEFCLALPERHFIHGGRRASLLRDVMADLLPADFLARRVRGHQGADWMEGLIGARADVLAELDRLGASPLASRALDLPRLRRLAEALPERCDAAAAIRLSDPVETRRYRLALMRGLSVGRFVRAAEGGNG